MRYFDNGRTTNWGEDLGKERMDAMAQGEVFTLLDGSGEPLKLLVRDSYGMIRHVI